MEEFIWRKQPQVQQVMHIVDTGVALKGSTDAQLVIVNIGASKTKMMGRS